MITTDYLTDRPEVRSTLETLLAEQMPGNETRGHGRDGFINQNGLFDMEHAGLIQYDAHTGTELVTDEGRRLVVEFAYLDAVAEDAARSRRARLSVLDVGELMEGDPVTGRRWGEQELITGRFVQAFGTGHVAILVQLADGDTAAIVADTASRAGRHRAELLLTHTPDRTPLPPAEEPTEQTREFNPIEQTEIADAVGELEEPADNGRVLTGADLNAPFGFDDVAEPHLLARFGRWVARNLTGTRVTVLTGTVGVLVGTGIGWWLA